MCLLAPAAALQARSGFSLVESARILPPPVLADRHAEAAVAGADECRTAPRFAQASAGAFREVIDLAPLAKAHDAIIVGQTIAVAVMAIGGRHSRRPSSWWLLRWQRSTCFRSKRRERLKMARFGFLYCRAVAGQVLCRNCSPSLTTARI
jgi:hypothetical protein